MNLLFWKNNKRRAAEEEVRHLLIHLVLQFSVNQRTDDILSALTEKFRAHPSLTYKTYPTTWRQQHTFPPLWHFLQLKASVPLDAIQALCSCTPKAKLLQHMKDYDLLHLACETSSPEVIEYLAKQVAPELVSEPRISGRDHTPLLFAMVNSRVPVSTLIMLLEICPDPIQGQNTWTLAMLTGQPPELLEYMASRYDLAHLRISESWRLSSSFRRYFCENPMSVPRTLAFLTLLPKLQSLRLNEIQQWDVESFVVLIKALETNTSITQLGCLNLPDCTVDAHGTARQAFQKFLQSNRTLEVLEVDLTPDDREGTNWEQWLRTIEAGMNSNRTIYFLKVDMVWAVREDNQYRRNEVSYICSCQEGHTAFRGRTLRLTNCGGFWGNYLARIPRVFRTIEQLKLEMTEDSSSRSSRRSSRNPNTESSPSIQQGVGDANTQTDAIISLLQHQDIVIEELILGSLRIDVVAILGALKTNNSLASLKVFDLAGTSKFKNPDYLSACRDLLKGHNMTLTTCSPWDMWDPPVRHHVNLNQWGRKKARTPGEDMTRLLLNVMATRIRDDGNSDQFIRDMLFGLLRESPGLWCHAAAENASKARPRPPPEPRKRVVVPLSQCSEEPPEVVDFRPRMQFRLLSTRK